MRKPSQELRRDQYIFVSRMNGMSQVHEIDLTSMLDSIIAELTNIQQYARQYPDLYYPYILPTIFKTKLRLTIKAIAPVSKLAMLAESLKDNHEAMPFGLAA